MKIGFVGLGLMGYPMALRLIKAGFKLHIFSKNDISLKKLYKFGAVIEKSITSLANNVDVFCSCRVTSNQSKDIFIGRRGVLNASRKPKICIDFATIDPSTSINIATKLKGHSIEFIDAPVSGGPDKASEGKLTIIVGGQKSSLRKTKRLFDTLGSKILHMGDVGSGVKSKLCNNLISISTHALIAEAMILGLKSGIDLKKLYEVLKNSSAYSKTLERVVPNHFITRNFKAKASIETIIKDLGVAIELGKRNKLNLLIAKNAMKYFNKARDCGHGLDDISSVIIPMENEAGILVKKEYNN